MTVLSLILFCAGAVAYVISQLSIQGKLIWDTTETEQPAGFWGSNGWLRKYAVVDGRHVPAKNNWYTKLFVIKYKEKYWLSGSFLVFASDSYHFFQMLFLLLISAAMAILTGENWLLWLLIYRAAFGVIFTIAYKTLAK